MVGLCYSNLHYDQLGVQNLQGLMFILVTENTFPAMYGVLSLFPQVRPSPSRPPLSPSRCFPPPAPSATLSVGAFYL